MSYLFTSEAVSAGHPDKICDQISDTLLDLFLAADPTAHTAIEAMATTGRIIIAGETLGNNRPQAEEIENAVRTLIKTIGYDQPGFSYKNVQITDLLHCQSADIAAGIKDCGAGDQGIMFGYAEKEHGFDSEYMPSGWPTGCWGICGRLPFRGWSLTPNRRLRSNTTIATRSSASVPSSFPPSTGRGSQPAKSAKK